MQHVHPSMAFRDTSGLSVFFARLSAEVGAFLKAIASPGTIIAEVEQMQALRRRAERIEAADPAGAQELRRRASRLGLY